MKPLFSGILTHFATTPHSSFYNGVNGQLYLEEAPSTAQFPYAVYSLSLNEYDCSFTSNFEEARINFELFSDSTGGAVEITNLYEKLKVDFDNCHLTLGSSYILSRFRRESADLTKLPDILPERPVWVYSVTYRVLTRKARS